MSATLLACIANVAKCTDGDGTLGNVRLAIENDKPELARVKTSIEELKAELKIQTMELEKLVKKKEEKRTHKKELKVKLVSGCRTPFTTQVPYSFIISDPFRKI